MYLAEAAEDHVSLVMLRSSDWRERGLAADSFALSDADFGSQEVVRCITKALRFGEASTVLR
jgi:hypothetical protein